MAQLLHDQKEAIGAAASAAKAVEKQSRRLARHLRQLEEAMDRCSELGIKFVIESKEDQHAS